MSQIPRVPQDVLPRLWQAGVEAVAAGPAVRRALEQAGLPARSWTRVLALGKAAAPMAVAAVEELEARGLKVRDGLVITAHPLTLPHPVLQVVPGDHPLPGPRSARAAAAVARFAESGRPGDFVLVLLSGGASSLIAAPVPGLGSDDLSRLHARLLRSGLPIGTINRIRRRFGRWSGGRLAAALAPADLLVLAISDVPGNRFADIGSGPCTPDLDTAASLLSWIKAEGLLDLLPPDALDLLQLQAAGSLADSPQPGDPRLASVQTLIIASNADAVAGVIAGAGALGLRAEAIAEPLAGEAAEAGRHISRMALEDGRADCLVWGGETTVTLPPEASGRGGRSQELALAAAEVIAGGDSPFPAVLAAGTDGIDGNTDAAGAVVTPATWGRIRRAGRDPAADLAGHDSHAALAAAGALLRTGPTGTNVMDLVIALRR